MRRIGPWIFAAGLVVLCAGILSTRSASWKKPEHDKQVIALDLQGVDTLDVGSYRYEKLTISELHPAIRIEWYGRAGAGDDPARVAAIRDGRHMRLAWKLPLAIFGKVMLDLPPTLGGLSGRRLDIKSQTTVGALHIEAFDLDWRGDAQALDIRTRAWSPESPRDCVSTPSVTIDGGKVERLRISIERGDVYFGDLSQVGRIEVHAGTEVGLKVSRVEDLQRIKLFPFDGEPTPPPAAPAGRCIDGLRVVM